MKRGERIALGLGVMVIAAAMSACDGEKPTIPIPQPNPTVPPTPSPFPTPELRVITPPVPTPTEIPTGVSRLLGYTEVKKWLQNVPKEKRVKIVDYEDEIILGVVRAEDGLNVRLAPDRQSSRLPYAAFKPGEAVQWQTEVHIIENGKVAEEWIVQDKGRNYGLNTPLFAAKRIGDEEYIWVGSEPKIINIVDIPIN